LTLKIYVAVSVNLRGIIADNFFVPEPAKIITALSIPHVFSA